MIDGVIVRLLRAARWLCLPVALLLFLQWPLREWVQAGSREANDLGQWLFALFVAVSIVAATRVGEHIATDVVSAQFSVETRRRLGRIGICLGLLPWAVFVLWAVAPQISQSLRQAERFPDTANPGYFMVKVALGLLLVLLIVQGLADFWRGRRP